MGHLEIQLKNTAVSKHHVVKRHRALSCKLNFLTEPAVLCAEVIIAGQIKGLLLRPVLLGVSPLRERGPVIQEAKIRGRDIEISCFK